MATREVIWWRTCLPTISITDVARALEGKRFIYSANSCEMSLSSEGFRRERGKGSLCRAAPLLSSTFANLLVGSGSKAAKTQALEEQPPSIVAEGLWGGRGG